MNYEQTMSEIAIPIGKEKIIQREIKSIEDRPGFLRMEFNVEREIRIVKWVLIIFFLVGLVMTVIFVVTSLSASPIINGLGLFIFSGLDAIFFLIIRAIPIAKSLEGDKIQQLVKVEYIYPFRKKKDLVKVHMNEIQSAMSGWQDIGDSGVFVAQLYLGGGKRLTIRRTKHSEVAEFLENVVQSFLKTK
jgi:hypothetical protein